MPVMGYTTVRVNVGALIIDGIDDDDIYDDVPVSGKLLLEPMIEPGRPVQVADGGRMKIKAIAPFPVDIGLNGEISYRNKDFVTVPAPTSATSNVAQLQWRATFQDLKYGTTKVTVPPIYFWAEPGLQVDLGDHINIAPNPTAVQLSRGARGFGVVGAVPVEDEPVASFAIEYETASGTALSDPIPLPEGSGGGLTEQEADTRYVPVPAAPGTTGQVLAKTADGVAWTAPPASNSVIPTMAGLMRALKAGQSVALTTFSDSTGESDGSVPAEDRTVARFVRRIATAHPTHHVMMKTLNASGTGYGPWVTMQAHASGRRHANITTRSLRYVPPVLADAQFASGALDIRVLVALSTLTPTASQALVGRTRKEVAGAFSNDLQFELFVNTAGNLVFHHSTDGAAFISDRVSTVPIPATVGVPIWLRATYEHTFGAVFSVNFYTSEDGLTWTKLGATVTGGNTTTPVIWPASAGSFFETGARAWQPAAAPFTGGKIYEVQIRDGVAGPMIAPAAVEVWERYGDAATSFGGAPTFYVINNARSGSAMAYHKEPARLKLETADYGQAALLFNDGHNETTFTGSKWIPPYEEWVTLVKNRLPNAAVNVIGQNPHTPAWVNEAAYGIEHVKRILELSAAASRLGWGFINVFQAYLDDPRGVAALISSDGLHPIVDGYVLSGDTVAKAAGIG